MILSNDYEISRSTMAILPYYHNQAQAKVLDTRGEIYVELTPLQLIKRACLSGGSSFEGRISAMKYVLEAIQKAPIPINPCQNIFAFPTKSPQAHDTIWFFFEHVSKAFAENKNVFVQFKNNHRVKVDVSYYTIKNQIERTSLCMARFSPLIYQASLIAEASKVYTY